MDRRLLCALRLFCFVCLLSPCAAHGQVDPSLGVDRFPQFRNLSGLAGGGYGVDMKGYGSLDGPVALSTPVAYVLGRGQFRVGVARASFVGEPHFLRAVNGTGILTYGATLGRWNIAVTDMLLSGHSDQAFHFQAQYVSSPGSRWAGSIGIQDAGGGAGSAGDGLLGDSRSSRSVFGAATYRWGMGRRTVYISGGAGTRRFRQGFVSASTQVLRPLRLWAEHDGFGMNAGGLLTLQTGHGRNKRELNLLYGMMRLRFAVASVVVGF